MRGISFVVAPIVVHAFFEETQFKRLLRNNLFEILSLPTQCFDLIRVRSTRGITRQTLLTLLSVTRTDGVPSAVHEVL